MIKKYRFVLFFAVILLYIYLRGIGDHGLFDPIEGVNSSISLNMLSHANYLRPKIGVIDFAGKSLGAWWLSALALKIFGWSEFAVRFWPALAGIFIALSAALSAETRRGAWFAAVISASMTLCFTASQIAASYTLYACCMGFALAGFIKIARYERYGEIFAFAASVLGFVIHGVEGLIMPWFTLGLFSLITQNYEILSEAVRFKISSAMAVISLVIYLIIIAVFNPTVLIFMTYKSPVLINYDLISGLFFILFAFTPWTGFLLQALWDIAPKNSAEIHVIMSEESFNLKLFTAFYFLTFFLIGVFSWDLFMLSACIPAAGVIIGDSLDEWLELGRVTTIQGAAAGNSLILFLAVTAGLPAAFYLMPLLKGTAMSLIPWGVFILIFIFITWYFSRKRQVMILVKCLMIAALLCLMPLAGIFDLAATNFSLRESGLILRDNVKSGDTMIQYDMHSPSLYFYSLANYVLSKHSPSIAGIASQKFRIDDDKLTQAWMDEARYFLVVSKTQNFIPPLPADTFPVIDLDREKIIVLSNK